MKLLGFNILMLFVCSFYACNQTNSLELDEKLRVEFIDNITGEESKEFMLNNWPTKEELKTIFKKEYVGDVIEYSEFRKNQLTNMPNNLMKPRTPETKIEIESITQDQLKAKEYGGFHEINEHLVGKFQKGVKMYAIKFVNGGKIEKFRSGMFFAGGRWIFLPYPAHAFRPKKPR